MTYASWKKCDFQVHSPRDPNWVGARPVGSGEVDPATGQPVLPAQIEAARAQWADEFVGQCADRGLQAVALTDHHEMIMIPYVMRAISSRMKADPGFSLWLFPGMELTCRGGVQCIILFDTDLPENSWQLAQGKLGIDYTVLDPNQAKGPPLTQLESVYPDIGAALDTLPGLKGRYIILPNVSQGGGHTVLTEGSHADFWRMPYVGGYLDRGQTLDTLLAKNRQRLSGELEQWSVRRIYPLPTSDCRSADRAHLGTNNTWIKVAAPTAEAVRQAFLGFQSRISIGPPRLASLAVAKLKIEGSAILAPTEISLSPELNSFIGGRGSGKSSLLEYLAFALGRSSSDAQRDHYSETARMRDLITDTLTAKSATVTMDLLQDGAVFTIVRSPATSYQPKITYPNGTSQTISTKELRALFPAVVYSQGELAEIGKQAGTKAELSDLLQFVDADYKREDDRLLAAIASTKGSVTSAVQKQEEFWSQQANLHRLMTSRDSLRQRVAALEKTLPKLSAEDQATVAFFDEAAEFEAKRIQASKHADQIVGDLVATAAALDKKRDLSSALVSETKAIAESYAALHTQFATGLSALVAALKTDRAVLTEAETAWKTLFEKARVARDAVLEKLGEHSTVTAQIVKLREQIAQLTNEINDLEALLLAQGDPGTALTAALIALKEAVAARATRTQAWAKEIETLSAGKIEAVVDPQGDITAIREAIDIVAAKTGSQEATRIRELDEGLRAHGLWTFLDRLRADCFSLLYWRLLGSATGAEPPACLDLLKVLGASDKLRDAITERMDTARLVAISAAVPVPAITLSYIDKTRKISFEKASEGQRAAALLFMLLEQPGGPLIIDQPEGDLDNRIIAELTDKLHTAKGKRQIIFASHNANIVVNGSSELVGHLEVTDTGARQFECVGAIDDPEIRKVITGTMEGGERAFKDRQNKYGY